MTWSLKHLTQSKGTFFFPGKLISYNGTVLFMRECRKILSIKTECDALCNTSETYLFLFAQAMIDQTVQPLSPPPTKTSPWRGIVSDLKMPWVFNFIKILKQDKIRILLTKRTKLTMQCRSVVLCRVVPDTILPDTGFNRIVIYRIPDIPDSSKHKHKS